VAIKRHALCSSSTSASCGIMETVRTADVLFRALSPDARTPRITPIPPKHLAPHDQRLSFANLIVKDTMSRAEGDPNLPLPHMNAIRSQTSMLSLGNGVDVQSAQKALVRSMHPSLRTRIHESKSAYAQSLKAAADVPLVAQEIELRNTADDLREALPLSLNHMFRMVADDVCPTVEEANRSSKQLRVSDKTRSMLSVSDRAVGCASHVTPVAEQLIVAANAWVTGAAAQNGGESAGRHMGHGLIAMDALDAHEGLDMSKLMAFMTRHDTKHAAQHVLNPSAALARKRAALRQVPGGSHIKQLLPLTQDAALLNSAAVKTAWYSLLKSA